MFATPSLLMRMKEEIAGPSLSMKISSESWVVASLPSASLTVTVIVCCGCVFGLLLGCFSHLHEY